ncbi:MAG: CocE/NonD family hydrolase [Promethearchaeota archaeon]
MKIKKRKKERIYSYRDLGYSFLERAIMGLRVEPFLYLLENIANPLMKILHLIVYNKWLKGSSCKLREVLIETSDGAKLATDVFLPKNIYRNKAKAPTIFIRTPYWKDSIALVGHYISLYGYVAVIQDIRGTGHSCPYGNNSFFFSERNDAIETAEWIKKQFWYNGKLGMWGASYLGICQWAVSYDTDELFQCLSPALATPKMIWSAHNGLDILGIGVDIARIFHESTKFNNPIRNFSKELTHKMTENFLRNPKYALYNDPIDKSNFILDLEQDFRNLSFEEKKQKIKELFDIDFNKRDFRKFQYLIYKFLIQKRANLFSENMPGMLEFDVSKLSVPVLVLSGWYDMFSRPAMETFTEIQQKAPKDVAEKCKIIVGPWAHGDIQIARGTIWQAIYSPGGWLDFVRTFVPWRWYDYFLRNKKDGFSNLAPVKIFVMNRGEWRYEETWPIKRERKKQLFLHSNGVDVWKPNGGGLLSFDFPKEEEPIDEYIFDPMNPVISRGGNNLMLPKGAMNQKIPESRKDTLVYTTPPLKRGIEVTGNVEFILYASTDCEDTDFMIKLCDVSPKGQSINILDRGIRARFRKLDYKNPQLLEPHKIYEYKIPLGPTSNYFKENHRIRIDITSSDWPKYNINSNLGGKGGRFDYKIAHQKIYHTADYPSHVILPIIEDYF